MIQKIRNLMTRLRVKLGCDLFDTLHGYGHSLKYKKIKELYVKYYN